MQLWKPGLTIDPIDLKEQYFWGAFKTKKENSLISCLGLYDVEENWEIKHFWVHPDFIRQGIGRRMFHFALEFCKGYEYKTIKVTSEPFAAGFYKKLGAVQVAELQSKIPGRKKPVFQIDLS